MNGLRGMGCDKIIARGLLAFLLLAFLLSSAVSSGVLARWMLGFSAVGLLSGAALVVVVASLIMLAARPPGGGSDARFLIGISVGVLIIRAGLIALVPGYEQAADCRFMLDAIRILAADGFGDDVMKRLAGIYYDDYLWAGRSIPFLLPLAKLAPGHEVFGARVLNLAWSLLHNLLVFGLCYRIAGRRTARLAFVLVSAIPLHTWMMLDFTHQYYGGFLVLAGVYVLAVQLDDPVAGWGCTVWRGLLFGLVVLALVFQSGIDRFMLVLAVAATCFAALAWGWRSRRLVRLVAMLVVAGAVFMPPAHYFNQWLDQYRPLRMSSHPISFTARGWNLDTLGEYYGVYEQIDRETPWPHKPEAMQALILSQMVHEPVKTMMLLPTVKVAKYFLIGYATAIEQQLEGAGAAGLGPVFKGTRLFFAPLFLLLCAFGTWKLFGRGSEASPASMLIIAAPAVFCLVYMVAGETSPRYSFHIQGFLAILAAHAFVAPRADAPARRQVLRLSTWWFLFVAGLGTATAGLPPLIRTLASPMLFADMRGVEGAGHDATVFTRVITARGGDAEMQELELSKPPSRGNLSLFVWPLLNADSMGDARLMVLRNGQVVFEAPLRAVKHVQRVALEASVQASNETDVIQVRIVRAGASWSDGAPLVRWGYLKYDP